MPAPSHHHFTPGALLRVAISGGVLAWIVWQVDWRDFGQLRSLDWTFALPALLLAGLAYPLQAWRWQQLLSMQAISLRPAWVHALFWLGNFYNSFLPGGIAGDGVRVYKIWQVAPDRKAGAAASVIADRLLGFGSLLGLAVAALGLHFFLTGIRHELRTLLIVSLLAWCGLLAGLCLLFSPRWWQPVARRWLGSEQAEALGRAVAAFQSRHHALAIALAASLCIWLLDFAALWLLAHSVGLTIGVLPLTVAASAAYVAASLPISIGGHGVREGTLVVVLGWLGFGAGQSGPVLWLALAFWAVTTGWSLAGGLAMIFMPGQTKSRPA